MIIEKTECLRCGACIGVCPQVALKLTEHGIEVDKEKCTLCEICVKICPVGAINVKK